MPETETQTQVPDGYSLLNFEADFVHIGRRRSVSDGSECEAKHPKWFDPELIQAGQAFIRKNLFSVFFAHFISLIFLLCYLPVRYTLIRTGRSNTKLKAIRRYLMTLIHIKGWYEGEFVSDTEELGPAVRDIHKIRIMHCRISKKLSANPASSSVTTKNEEDAFLEKQTKLVQAVQQDLKSDDDSSGRISNVSEDSSSQPIISQLDMAVTQFCFMGFISMYPEKFGIRESSDLGLRGFVHLWAVIGYHLGIEDKFNICLDPNVQTKPFIVSQILRPHLEASDGDTVKLWTSLTDGVASMIPFVSLRALLLYIIEKLFNTESVELRSLFNMYDSLCYKIMNFCFNCWTSHYLVRSAINALLRLAVHLTALRIFTASMTLPVTTTTQAHSRFSPISKISNNNNNLSAKLSLTSHV